MKINIISLCVLMGLAAGCQSGNAPSEYVEYVDDVEYQTVVVPYDDVPSTSQIKYSVPRDGDLTLETRHHVIQVHGAPNTAYEYRVWAGDKTYSDDPDLIVNDGNIMVLQPNE